MINIWEDVYIYFDLNITQFTPVLKHHMGLNKHVSLYAYWKYILFKNKIKDSLKSIFLFRISNFLLVIHNTE